MSIDGLIATLLFGFFFEVACQNAEQQTQKEIAYNDYSHYHPQDSKPAQVLALLEKLKIGELTREKNR